MDRNYSIICPGCGKKFLWEHRLTVIDAKGKIHRLDYCCYKCYVKFSAGILTESELMQEL